MTQNTKSTVSFVSILPCFYAIIIDALGFGLVYPVMTAMFTAAHSPVLPVDASIHMRHFFLGLGFLLYPLAMFFGASFMGDLSDQWGRKRVLGLCMLGIAISFGLMALGVELSSLTVLLIGRALSGLMAGSQPIAQAIIADISTEQNKARNMSFISVSYCVGVVLGPVLGGVMSDHKLVSWFNYATPFYISAILAVIAIGWLFFGYHDTAPVAEKAKFSFLRPILIFIDTWRFKTILMLALIFVLMQIGFSLYFQFVIVHMRLAFHYSNWQIGVFNGVLGAGFAIGVFIGTPLLLKFFNVNVIAIVMMFLTGAVQLLSFFIQIDIWQWILAVFIATFNMMTFSAMLTLFSNAVNEKRQGWAMGIASSSMAIAWTITGFGSNLINAIGAEGLILIGALALLLGSIILLLFKLTAWICRKKQTNLVKKPHIG